MVTVPTHTHPTTHTLALPHWRDVCRSVADALHARTDRRAWGDGLTVARIGLTGREYRSPLFDQVPDAWGERLSTVAPRPPVDDAAPSGLGENSCLQGREGVRRAC